MADLFRTTCFLNNHDVKIPNQLGVLKQCNRVHELNVLNALFSSSNPNVNDVGRLEESTQMNI